MKFRKFQKCKSLKIGWNYNISANTYILKRGTSQNHLERAGTTWNKLELPGTILNHLERTGTNWNHLERDEINKRTDIRSKKFVAGYCVCNIMTQRCFNQELCLVKVNQFLLLFSKVSLSYTSYNDCSVQATATKFVQNMANQVLLKASKLHEAL